MDEVRQNGVPADQGQQAKGLRKAQAHVQPVRDDAPLQAVQPQGGVAEVEGGLNASAREPRQVDAPLEGRHLGVGDGAVGGEGNALLRVLHRQDDVDAAGVLDGAGAVGPVGHRPEDDEVPHLQRARTAAPAQEGGGGLRLLRRFGRGAIGVGGVLAEGRGRGGRIGGAPHRVGGADGLCGQDRVAGDDLLLEDGDAGFLLRLRSLGLGRGLLRRSFGGLDVGRTDLEPILLGRFGERDLDPLLRGSLWRLRVLARLLLLEQRAERNGHKDPQHQVEQLRSLPFVASSR